MYNNRSSAVFCWSLLCLDCLILCTGVPRTSLQLNFTELRNVTSAVFVTVDIFVVTEVRLNYCGIKHIDRETFHNVVRLKYLDLSENDVEQLVAGTFRYLYYLEELNLCCNALQSLKNGIFDRLERVTTLKLYNNFITAIGSNVFRDMASLEQLKLYGNRITTLDGNIFKSNQKLVELSLSYNYIRRLHRNTFRVMKRLSRLHLSHNQLTALEKDQFLYLMDLVDLNLSVNFIAELPVEVFQYTRKLRKLSVAGNRLTALQDGLLWNLQQLESLHVEQNYISVIEGRTLPHTNTQLAEVHLGNNNLRHLNTSTLDSLKRVTRLFLNGNPWFCTCSVQELYRIWQNHRNNAEPVWCQGPVGVYNVTWANLPPDYFANCTAENQSSMRQPQVEQLGDDLYNTDGSFNRLVQQINHTVEVFLGDNVSFSCDNSNHYIVWLHNNTVIRPHHDRFVFFKYHSWYDTTPSLHFNITRVTFNDAGVYTCRTTGDRGVQENNFIVHVRTVPSPADRTFAWKIIGAGCIGVLVLVVLCASTVCIVKKCRGSPVVYDVPLNEPVKAAATIAEINTAELYEEVQAHPDKPAHVNTGLYDELKQICRRTSVDEDGYLRPAFINT